MKAALLPDRGVIKVAGNDARNFLHGLVTTDILHLQPGIARFCALLTPQGKIIADFFVAEAPASDGGGFFLDLPRALAPTLIGKLNLYKLRAKLVIEDLSGTLGVMTAWASVFDESGRKALPSFVAVNLKDAAALGDITVHYAGEREPVPAEYYDLSLIHI